MNVQDQQQQQQQQQEFQLCMSDKNLPPTFICPVTKTLLINPVRVRASCEHTINRDYFQQWLAQGNKVCPVCGDTLKGLYAKADHPLLKAMAEYQKESKNTSNKKEPAEDIQWQPRASLQTVTRGRMPSVTEEIKAEFVALAPPKRKSKRERLQRKTSSESSQGTTTTTTSSLSTSEHIVVPPGILKLQTYKVHPQPTPSKRIASLFQGMITLGRTTTTTTPPAANTPISPTKDALPRRRVVSFGDDYE